MQLLTNQITNRILKACLLTITLFGGNFLAAQDNITLGNDGLSGEVRELSFSSNGRTLIAKCGRDVVLDKRGLIKSPCIQLWDMETKKNPTLLADREIGRAACISFNGDMLAYRSQNDVSVMDVNQRKTVSAIKFSENRNAFARPLTFTADNRSLLISQGSKSMLHTVVGGGFEREISLEGINQILSSDDNYLIEVFVDSLRITDFKTGKEKGVLRCGKPGKQEEIKNVFFSPENRFLATQSDNVVRMWDLLTLKMTYTFNIGVKENVFAFSNDGRFIAGGQDTLKLWEVMSGKSPREVKTSLTFEGRITAAKFSPDDEEVRYLAGGDIKGNIKMWRFTEENISKEYFSVEIAKEISQIKAKGEFETSDEYNRRKQKAKRAIYNKYLSYYTEHVNNEKTMQEVALATIEDELEAKRLRILNSRTTIQFSIDSMSAYDADKESFTVRVVNRAENYNKVEVVRIPRRNNCAIDFKQNFKNLTVTGQKQLQQDERGFEIFNVKIKSNCDGNKEFEFGVQREFFAKE
ncbi:MAG: hypothetical protein RL757_2372 [Bacteroidota bacterium]